MTQSILRIVLPALLAAAFAVATAAAQTAPDPPAAAPPAADRLTPAEAQSALDALEDPAKRAQVIATLKALAVTAPQRPAAPAPPAKPASDKLALQPNGLGLELVVAGAGWAHALSQEIAATAHAFSDAPALWGGFAGLTADADTRLAALDGAWRIAVALAAALAAEGLLALALRRLVAALAKRAAAGEPGEALHRDEWRLARRFPLATLRLALALAPLGAFVAAGALVLATPLIETETPRLIGLELIKAYAIYRAIVCATILIAAPRDGRLRLLPTGDAGAAAIVKWTRRLAFLAVLGGTLAEAAQLLGADDRLRNGLVKTDALALALAAIVMIVQNRAAVAQRLRAAGRRGRLAALAGRLADVWHFLAIAAVAAIWLVWAVSWHDSLSRSLQLVVVTAIVLTLGRLAAIVAVGLFDRGVALSQRSTQGGHGFRRRALRYAPPLRVAVRAAIAVATLIVVLEAWGVDAAAPFRSDAIGGRLLSALATIAIAAAIAAAVWEAANETLERRLERLARDARGPRAARLRTLLPILRTSLLIVILCVVGLTALSQLGVNVAPLLAGAGIIGIAVGFGSQKLVQDLITGLFLLLENAIQVGDWVTVGALSGSVEQLSIRTMRLRSGDGSVHIVPFSSVTSVTNANRGLGNAAIAVSVAYEEDTDRVGDLLKQIAAEMRGEAKYGPAMLSDLQLWGVDKIDGVSAAIVGQIVCTDAGRWDVQREFNRRMKRRFQELGVRLAPPSSTMVIQPPQTPPDETAGDAPPAPRLRRQGEGRSG